MFRPLPRLTREQLAIALTRLREVRPWEEIAEDVAAVQQGLQDRLGCAVSVEEAIFAWERFSEDIYASGWEVVDRGSLNECAYMLQAAYAFIMREEAL